LDLVADENVDAPIVAALRAAGHRTVYVQELDPGIDDDQVLDLANRSGAFLLTSDKDFGELVFREGLVHAGVILYRLAGFTGERKAPAILNLRRTHTVTPCVAPSPWSPPPRCGYVPGYQSHRPG